MTIDIEKIGVTGVEQQRAPRAMSLVRFRNEWKETSLGELGYVYGGLSGKTKQDFETGTSSFIPFVNVMANLRIDPNSLESVLVASGESQNSVTFGDLIFNGSSETPEEVGLASVVDFHTKHVYLNSFCFGFHPHDLKLVDSVFIAYLFRGQVGRRIMHSLAQGSTRYNLSKSKLLAAKFKLPDIDEQRAIADVLSDIDLFLESQNKHIGKKIAIKKGAMQRLLTGLTRLPSYNDDWRLRPIGTMLKVKHGKSQKAVELDGGPYPILGTGGEMGRASQPLYSKPSVLIGRKGTIDKPKFIATPFWTVDTLFYTEIEPENDPKFLYYKFCMIDWYRYNEASGVPSLNASVIERIEINVPLLAEQVEIGGILSDMDAEIDALVARRDKTVLIKNGMMQDLLTGKVRL